MRRIAVLLMLVVLLGCPMRTRTRVLIPAMEPAWSHMQDDALRGGLSEEQVERFGIAMEARDILTIVTMWPMVRDASLGDITQRLEDGKISEGSAESLRERVRKFGEAVDKLERRP